MDNKPRRSDGIRSAADLMGRCTVDEITGCWTWRGGRDHHGRPGMWSPALRKPTTLGVTIAVIRTGIAPPKGVEWRSVCGFAECANPEHRRAGNRSANLLARRQKRTPAQIGRITAGKRRAAKLSEADVAAIRASDLPLRALAAEFGLSVTYTCEVRSGKKRRELAAPGSSVFAWRPA